MDLRPPLTAAIDAFGVDATVTRPSPDDTAIATAVIWMPPVRRARSDEVFAYRNELEQRQADRLVLSLPRTAVATMPLGTRIVAPPMAGGTSQTWVVEEIERSEWDEWRVVVVPGGEE